ncbi:hypothetical protein PVAP13_6NG289701 [Panicum virgatum]|uniref:Uncharacterized protein n=1 Tax=Panicum virgatum TaxID=38727 RepID=A0A8T0R2Q4_PANVG|nr:hypothetical protein PVAP13_6NG289701 [Panicum virgatum]
MSAARAAARMWPGHRAPRQPDTSAHGRGHMRDMAAVAPPARPPPDSQVHRTQRAPTPSHPQHSADAAAGCRDASHRAMILRLFRACLAGGGEKNGRTPPNHHQVKNAKEKGKLVAERGQLCA